LIWVKSRVRRERAPHVQNGATVPLGVRAGVPDIVCVNRNRDDPRGVDEGGNLVSHGSPVGKELADCLYRKPVYASGCGASCGVLSQRKRGRCAKMSRPVAPSIW
jgi:hypothetical protein